MTDQSGLIPCGGKDFSLHYCIQISPRAHHTFYPIGTGASVSGDKASSSPPMRRHDGTTTLRQPDPMAQWYEDTPTRWNIDELEPDPPGPRTDGNTIRWETDPTGPGPDGFPTRWGLEPTELITDGTQKGRYHDPAAPRHDCTPTGRQEERTGHRPGGNRIQREPDRTEPYPTRYRVDRAPTRRGHDLMGPRPEGNSTGHRLERPTTWPDINSTRTQIRRYHDSTLPRV